MPTASADGRRLVEQRSRRDRQPGEFGDQRLEIEQHLQPALADLGLVGRVGGVPGGVLEQVALDDRRHDGAVIAGADKTLQHNVGAHLRAELGQRLGFRCSRGQGERAFQANRLRHGLGNQRLDRRHADDREHGARVGDVRANMPGREAVGGRGHGQVSQISRYGRCSRPRRAGRKAGSRRRASSSRASRRLLARS